MTGIRIFFCVDAGLTRRVLRRYVSSTQERCGPGDHSYHNAGVTLDEVPTVEDELSGDVWPHDDPRWPKACEKCARPFADADEWQLFHRRLYRRADTGQIASWEEMPPGAVREMPWLADRQDYRGPDGRTLEVKLPDGRNWVIDSRCSNCTLPNDREHKCWVRHGRPEDGSLHVDKNGRTCSAGGGSIDTGTWHGFLRHGELIQC